MTVSSTATKASLSANGTNHSFAYGFKIFADADLVVIIRDAAGAETIKTLNTHYVVTGAGSDTGGNVLFKYNTGETSDAHYSATDNRPANGETVVIKRSLTLTQGTDYVANDPFAAEDHETALDRLTFIAQQQQEEIDRTFKVSQTNTIATADFTADAASRANKVLGFDASGDLIASQELGVFRGTDTTTTTTAYNVRDLVKSTTTAQLNNVYIALQDSPSGTLLTNTTYWALIVDAVAAATSAANAAASETAAGNSETASGNSEAAASTSATKSENYAVKVDGAVPSTSDHSSKAWAVGGTGVTDTAGAGAAKQWAVDQTADGVDGTEFSAKEYAIGVQQSVGSAKQWALGGGGSFDRDTAVTGSGLTAEYSAKYWANQAANSAKDFVDVYYGAFTTDTAAEDYQLNTNEGSVNVGDLYFNNSDNVLKVRTFAGWQDAAADTSSFATAGFSIAMSIAL
jgi:hypothetical protein